MNDIDFVPSEKELTEAESALKEVRASYDEAYGFHDDDVKYAYVSEKGLDEEKVRQISAMKNEPEWMTEIRVKAYHEFLNRPTPQWGGNLSEINYDNIYYYMRATDKTERNWEDVPPEIKDTFDKLGIPEAEQYPRWQMSLIMDVDNRGFQFTNTSIQRNEATSLCVETHVSYLLWVSEEEQNAAVFCDCYQRSDSASDWVFVETLNDTCNR